MVRVAHVGGHVVVVPGLAVGLVFRAYGLADDRNAAAVIDRNLILAGAFRRHQHHAERTPGAVYGRRGGVLEHRDALHVLGVHRRQVALHAVDQAERRSACADRLRVRTDVDRRRTARLAVGHRDVHARNLALDRPKQIGVGGGFRAPRPKCSPRPRRCCAAVGFRIPRRRPRPSGSGPRSGRPPVWCGFRP